MPRCVVTPANLRSRIRNLSVFSSTPGIATLANGRVLDQQPKYIKPLEKYAFSPDEPQDIYKSNPEHADHSVRGSYLLQEFEVGDCY